jgi:hypothetical protein
MPEPGASKAVLSRRGFLAVGGSAGAAAALGACGGAAEPRAEGDDGELLRAALAVESDYAAAGRASADQQGVSAAIEKASAQRREELEAAAEDAGAEIGEVTPQDGPATELAMAAIVAYREGARRLSTEELRTTATQFAAQVAGELAALNELDGEDPIPYAFVTGLDEPPLQSADDAPSGETTTTEDATTTSEGG